MFVDAVLQLHKGRGVSGEGIGALQPIDHIPVQMLQRRQKIAVAAKENTLFPSHRQAGTAAPRRHGVHAQQHRVQDAGIALLSVRNPLDLLQHLRIVCLVHRKAGAGIVHPLLCDGKRDLPQ